MNLYIKKIISIVLVLILTFSVTVYSITLYYAEGYSTLTYEFVGNNSQEPGFAQGKITLKADNGTYWLYWADEKEALHGYSEITKMDITNCEQSHVIEKRVAIPVGAKRIIAVKSDVEPEIRSIYNASVIWDIPENKIQKNSVQDKKYSFMSASDIHIDLTYSTYKYADDHWKMALDVANKRDADFIITSGDNINNSDSKSGIYSAEWQKYQRILADSDFCGPVYEAVGNHELFQGIGIGTKSFIKATGLEGNNNTSTKAYYEKEINGDHFIFMSLEGGFYPDRVNEFSDAQLNWLESLLKKYSGDGKNIFIIEHSPFYKYGAGDRVDAEPYYDIPLSDEYTSNLRFKKLLEAYKDTIFLSGHTHIAFQGQFNYSDNSGTSGQMIHNSSVGGPREIVNNTMDRNYETDEAEAYIVDVYDDAIIFNGTNVYYNEYDPNCCYMVDTSQQRYEPVVETESTTASTSATSETQLLEKSNIYLKGSFNNWSTANPLFTTTNQTVYSTTIQLSSGTYTFKLNKGSTWYGNTGTVENTTTATSRGGWVMSSAAGDCTLKASGGYYQFDFDTSNNKLKIFYYTSNPAGTTPTEPETEPEISEPELILGDVDENGRISINDATKIQMDLANINHLTESQRKIADINFDEMIDINDVTLIQKHCAKLIASFEFNAIDTGDKTLESALKSVENNLDLYYRYSSYDCYQQLKKEYYSTKRLFDKAVIDTPEMFIKTLIGLENKLLSVVDPQNVDFENKECTVYFENAENWTNVYAYCWGDEQKVSWPGEKLTISGTNNLNNLYGYTVDTEKYNFVIFNNGSDKQTKDIYVSDNNAIYKIEAGTSPYDVTFNIKTE